MLHKQLHDKGAVTAVLGGLRCGCPMSSLLQFMCILLNID